MAIILLASSIESTDTLTGDLNKPAGVVLRLDVVTAIEGDKFDSQLLEFAKASKIVPPAKPCHKILQEMIHSHQQLFLVADEEGKTLGLITLEDVIEEMLGEEIE